MTFLFFLSIAFLAYTFVGYPVVLAAWAALRPRPVHKKAGPRRLSVVLAVRDEAKNIAARVSNFFDQEYPPDLVEVVVVSDGSTDATADIARSMGDPRIRVLELERPMGKAAAVNAGIARAAHEIVVFADARQSFAKDVFRELTAAFADDRVGAVSGELVILRDGQSEVGEGVGLYWEYEKFIRRKESEIDSVVGASGSIYAMRKELFEPLPVNTLLDDFLAPMRVVLGGRRVVFERRAKAYDRAADRASQEFSRKVRTLAGNFQAMALEKALLSPRKNRVFFQMVSHKLMRLIAPYFLVAAFVSNAFLDGPAFRAVLALQTLFYLSILFKFTPIIRSPAGALVRVAWTFVVLNAAAVAGFWVYASRKESAVWKRPRS